MNMLTNMFKVTAIRPPNYFLPQWSAWSFVCVYFGWCWKTPLTVALSNCSTCVWYTATLPLLAANRLQLCEAYVILYWTPQPTVRETQNEQYIWSFYEVFNHCDWTIMVRIDSDLRFMIYCFYRNTGRTRNQRICNQLRACKIKTLCTCSCKADIVLYSRSIYANFASN